MVPMMLQLEPTSSGIMHTESKGKGGEEKSGGERAIITRSSKSTILYYDERILTSITIILTEKHNLGTCEESVACACVGQPIHSSQYLGKYVSSMVLHACEILPAL